MREKLQQYKGFYPYKTDSKNRVNVYSAWRPGQNEEVYLMRSRSEGVPILKVMTQAGYDFRLSVIVENVKDPKEQAKTITALARACTPGSVNDQGKILIPQQLAAYAGIGPDTEVMLASGDSHFEIWNREKYEEIFGDSVVSEEDDKYGIF